MYSETTIIVKNNGTIQGCGSNSYGQLGILSFGNNYDYFVNMATGHITSSKKVEFISSGFNYTVILMDDGIVWATGRNFLGQLGIGNNSDVNILTQMNTNHIMSSKRAKYICCGGSHTLVLMNDGIVWATGWNNGGQLGNGNQTNFNILTQTNLNHITSSKIAKSISIVEYNKTVILMDDGVILATNYTDGGDDYFYDLVILSPMTLFNNLNVSIMPVSIKGTTTVNVLMDDNTIWSNFQSSGFYELIQIDTSHINSSKIPKTLSSGGGLIVLMDDGFIWGISSNSWGQLGLGNNTDTSILTMMEPVWLFSSIRPINVSSSIFHTIVLMDDMSLWGTGRNNTGQLALGNFDNTNLLTMTDSSNNVVYISDMNFYDNIQYKLELQGNLSVSDTANCKDVKTTNLYINTTRFRFVDWTAINNSSNNSSPSLVLNMLATNGTSSGTSPPLFSTNNKCKYFYSVIGNTMYMNYIYTSPTIDPSGVDLSGNTGTGIYAYKIPAGYTPNINVVIASQPNFYTSAVNLSSKIGSSSLVIDETIYSSPNNSVFLCSHTVSSPRYGIILFSGSSLHQSSGLTNYGVVPTSNMNYTFECSFPIL